MASPDFPIAQNQLDRHHLHNVRSAFLSLNEARLALARESLAESQRIFLDVLPCLIHFNHPMLPGYLSRTTPSGLEDFKPTEEQVQQLHKLTRSFQNKNQSQQHARADILSLFSMGSFGTIAQNSKSDIDIWLCYRPDMDDDRLSLLEKKCGRICEWAKTLQLDVTIFLMNNQAFRLSNKLDFNKEASGSTQHYLLLDEFYRTAIHLGGQLPAWIFVHPGQEDSYNDYFKSLNQQRLLPEKKLIDFGRIEQIPASEFISSAIWQLYKAIDSPYKSIMKLLVLEIYCQNLSKPELLSTLFKKQLHSVDRRRVIHLWDADPYLQTYYFIENYLISTDQKERLEFLRRCFYFKLEQPLTEGYKISPKSSMLLEMTKFWGWGDKHIHHLDNHSRWPLKNILEERRLIISELNYSYHLIMEFFRSQKIRMSASNKELNILGRKLHAAFSKKVGKVDWANPLLSKSIAEPLISIKNNKTSNLWLACDKNDDIIIKKPTLIELITWLHCNQVMIASSRIQFEDIDIDSRLFQSLRRFVTSLLPLPIKAAKHEVFEKGCHLKKLLFFINYTAQSSYKNTGNELEVDISSMECKIDYLSINSWNEIICDNKSGLLVDSILPIVIDALQKEGKEFNPDILINHPNRNIQQKLRSTFDALFKGIDAFFKKNQNGRYITYIDQQYLMIHINPKRAEIKWLSTERELKKILTSIMPYYSPVGIDENTMAYHPLSIFSGHHQADSIQVFFRPRGQHADITLIDELGIWYECIIDHQESLISLQAFHRFLRAINDRRLDQPKADVSPLDILPIKFYEIAHTNNGWQAQVKSISSQVDKSTLAFEAAAEYIDGEYKFILNHGSYIFSEVAENDNAYQKLNEFIQSKLSQDKKTTVDIVDLDLSRCRSVISDSGEIYTSHYLKIKSLLENKIAQAIKF
ncbi:MAG: class I adenylate cyclase [Cellvibrionaceae bacterium]